MDQPEGLNVPIDRELRTGRSLDTRPKSPLKVRRKYEMVTHVCLMTSNPGLTNLPRHPVTSSQVGGGHVGLGPGPLRWPP